MTVERPILTLAAAMIAAAVLAGGCSTGSSVPVPAPPRPTPVAGATPPASVDNSGGHNGHKGDPGVSAAPAMPADFPREVPVPQGVLQNSAGSGGHWTFLLLTTGSAADVLRSTADLYRSAGFTTDSDQSIPVTLRRASYTVTALVENRDHSNGNTFLLMSVSTT
jgi:hypothetical protein